MNATTLKTLYEAQTGREPEAASPRARRPQGDSLHAVHLAPDARRRTQGDARRAHLTVPALRMKAKREHRLPLCGRALEILDAARALGEGNPLVFPMRSGRAISASTLPKMLQYHEIAAVAHGFRFQFPGLAAEETDHPREVIEAALAHVVQNKVEAAYARSDLFERRRRRLMDDWAVYLSDRSD